MKLKILNLFDLFQLEGGKVFNTLVMMFCAGIFNSLHNVLAFSVLALVSPLSYAVANATKRIVIIGGSLMILQNPVSSMNVVGMLVAIFGVLTYNKVCSLISYLQWKPRNSMSDNLIFG